MEDLERPSLAAVWQKTWRIPVTVFQNYYLPRASLDKRRPHYSGLIVSGQMRGRSPRPSGRIPLRPRRTGDRPDYFKKLRINRARVRPLIGRPLAAYRLPDLEQLPFTQVRHSFLKMLTGSYNVYS